jgi:hypothetical protein
VRTLPLLVLGCGGGRRGDLLADALDVLVVGRKDQFDATTRPQALLLETQLALLLPQRLASVRDPRLGR